MFKVGMASPPLLRTESSTPLYGFFYPSVRHIYVSFLWLSRLRVCSHNNVYKARPLCDMLRSESFGSRSLSLHPLIQSPTDRVLLRGEHFLY